MHIPSITTQQMVEVDRLMIEEYGITLIQMMENAGIRLVEMARRMCGGTVQGKQLVVLCGPGNNGGGGMVAARHLHNWGAQVQAILIGDAAALREVPKHQWRILQRMGITRLISAQPGTLPAADLVIDALLGYGAQGSPRPPISTWITLANQSGCPILSLDAPSGLNTTTGQPGDPTIRAARTVTLALPKTGLLAPTAAPYVGELYLADISIPPELYAAPGLGLSVGPLFKESGLVLVPRQ